MSHYNHLTIDEREKILVLKTQGKCISQIAKELGRSKSTITREFSRNKGNKQAYSAVKAQNKYQRKRKNSRRKKLLEQAPLFEQVRHLFLDEQWSPEQISERIRMENGQKTISFNTIYRAIYAKMFDTPEQRQSSQRGAARKLRHRGKTRRTKGSNETRGKIVISNRIEDRPPAAQDRSEIGHWEGDTVAGKLGQSCLATMADRASRYALAKKISGKTAEALNKGTISLFQALPDECLKSITPDRGKEFAKHAEITKALHDTPFYFPNPHAPWERGTNENTNGLLREYFPKSFDFDACPDEVIAQVIDKLNHRPRKCLNWRSPFEVFFGVALHLT